MHKLVFLSDASDLSFAAGDVPHQSFSRGQLSELPETANVLEHIQMYNRTAQQLRAQKPPSSPRPLPGGKWAVDSFLAYEQTYVCKRARIQVCQFN